MCMHNKPKHPCNTQALRVCTRATTRGLESICLLQKAKRSLRSTCSPLHSTVSRSQQSSWRVRLLFPTQPISWSCLVNSKWPQQGGETATRSCLWHMFLISCASACVQSTFMGHTKSLRGLSLAELSVNWGFQLLEEENPKLIWLKPRYRAATKARAVLLCCPASGGTSFPSARAPPTPSPRHQLRNNIWLCFLSWKLIKNRVYHPYKLISSSKLHSWAFSSLHTAPKIVSEDAELLSSTSSLAWGRP